MAQTFFTELQGKIGYYLFIFTPMSFYPLDKSILRPILVQPLLVREDWLVRRPWPPGRHRVPVGMILSNLDTDQFKVKYKKVHSI